MPKAASVAPGESRSASRELLIEYGCNFITMRIDMPTEAIIEERLSAVEAAIVEIRRRLPGPSPDWLERVIGSQAGEPAFEEVLALGRAHLAGN